MMTEQIKNYKYNTLTPAEARKLNRVLGNRQPLRTASVLRKPRAPPIVVTNLDNELEKQISQLTISDTFNGCNSLTRQASMRASSLCPAASDSRRHTVNYGHAGPQHQRQGALASRLSLYSTASTKSSSTAYQHQQLQQGQPQQAKQFYQISPHESFTNLSLRSCSRDAPDCANGNGGSGCYDPTYRFQTMSIDLSNPIAQRAQQMTTSTNRAYDTMRGRARYAPQRSNTLNYRFSDDSFASAKSDLSAKSSSVTPTKFNPIPISTSASARQQPREPSRSASKASLSSSTYKVFQSPFANFKKLFRGMQKPFANSNQQTSQVSTEQKARPTSIATPLQYHQQQQPQQQQQRQQQQQCGRSLNDFSLSDSTISHHLSLSSSKSQSPPACAPPPPPGELKSMSYLENSINYSNYDEFTRSRNERLMIARQNSTTSSVGGGGDIAVVPPQPPPQPVNNPPVVHQQQHYIAQSSIGNAQASGLCENVNSNQQQTYDTVANDENDNSNWQMTSLPVYYERNLTTVFEETKQASYEMSGGSATALPMNPATMTSEEIYQRLKPPRNFDDPNNQQQQQQQVVGDEPSENCERASSVASSDSPALSSAGESVLEFHRQQPATPYRFSFAQPQPDPDQTSLGRSLGLPPRAPLMGVASHLTGTNNKTSENQRQENNSSSSGNSSNCSSQINGINHCDKQRTNPTDSSTPNSHYKSPAEVAVSDAIDKLSAYSMASDSGGGGYGAVSGLSNDADATLLSESSTLQNDSADSIGGRSGFYAQKCAELERTVATLKNKLISKEKELTDLQLSQLNNDYTIERLQKQVGKLERENAQLKTMLVTRTGNGAASNANAMGRIHA